LELLLDTGRRVQLDQPKSRLYVRCEGTQAHQPAHGIMLASDQSSSLAVSRRLKSGHSCIRILGLVVLKVRTVKNKLSRSYS
jgi:hypothetical protein